MLFQTYCYVFPNDFHQGAALNSLSLLWVGIT